RNSSRPVVRCQGVVETLHLNIYWKLAKPEDLAESAAHREGPLLSASQPVGGDDRRRDGIPTIAEVIIVEGLKGQKIHLVSAQPGRAPKGPHVVDEPAVNPESIHAQQHHRWARAPQIAPNRGIGGGQQYAWADAPDPFPGMHR